MGRIALREHTRKAGPGPAADLRWAGRAPPRGPRSYTGTLRHHRTVVLTPDWYGVLSVPAASNHCCRAGTKRNGVISCNTKRKDLAMKTISIVKMQPLKMTRCGSYHAVA